MSTIPENSQLIKYLITLIETHRQIFQQEGVYQRSVALILAEVMVFARHTVTQMLVVLGQAEQDWSA